ncbi:flagellin [Guptibacillus hwajinpoensis]|uniref:flagellin n=1 Tax=Guptibacillus hwajinpoensis TaxID=208199 RepID=UPI001CFE7499|nr:flagellin [Pseudalkalibacillus hwajinpoensis]
MSNFSLYGVHATRIIDDEYNISLPWYSIARMRRDLGSYQNELERISHINKTTSMNLTASASRIEDYLAEEAMKQAKSSILNQSAEAMLLHANQQAGEVLNLLK